MPRYVDRKRRTREHVIADLSVNYVERCVLQCGWTIQRFSPDYGLDLLLATFNRRGEIENGEVRLQLKATDSVRIVSRRQSIAVRLDWRDVVYWLNEWLPVILIVYDAKNERAWWLYVQEGLREQLPKSRLRVSATLTAHIPLVNLLNAAAVRKFARFRDDRLAER